MSDDFDPADVPHPGRTADAYADIPTPQTFPELGVRYVLLTDAEARSAFRALNVLAWLMSLGFETQFDTPFDISDADELRTLARVICAEGVGDLGAGE